jgi:uncharacterized membrane protein
LVALLVLLILVGLLALGFVALVRRRRRPIDDQWAPSTPKSKSDPALNELRSRFARGEISEDEFMRHERLLGATGSNAEGAASTEQEPPSPA